PDVEAEHAAGCATSTAAGNADRRARTAFRNKPRRADLSGRAVSDLVRRRTRAAILSVWVNGLVRGSRGLLSAGSETKRGARLRCPSHASIRHRQVPRGDDGVSDRGDDQGLPVADLTRLSQPQTGRTASLVPHGHSDRAAHLRAKVSEDSGYRS